MPEGNEKELAQAALKFKKAAFTDFETALLRFPRNFEEKRLTNAAEWSKLNIL